MKECESMNNEELLIAIRENGFQDNRLLIDLWNRNSGIIWEACKKYVSTKLLEEEDAKQECYFAFVDAVKEYDTEAGTSFAGYLYRRCKWHLSRYADDCGQIVRLPENRQHAIRNYSKFVQKWYQMKGEGPDAWTLKMYLGLSRDDLDQLREDMQALNIRSIDEPLTDNPEDGTTADLVQDKAADVEAAGIDPLFCEERRQAVWGAVNSLPEKQGEAIRLYYCGGLTYKQAGSVSGVSPERIRVRIASGLRKLRTEKRFKELREFVDLSPVYGRAISGTGSGTFHRTGTSSTEKTALWLLEAEERWKQEREEIEKLIERNKRNRKRYEHRKMERQN